MGFWLNWNLEMLVLWSEENQKTQRKSLEAMQELTTDSTHMFYQAGIEPGPHSVHNISRGSRKKWARSKPNGKGRKNMHYFKCPTPTPTLPLQQSSTDQTSKCPTALVSFLVGPLSWLNWNLDMLVLWREENQENQRKSLGAMQEPTTRNSLGAIHVREPTTNSTHMFYQAGIEPRPHSVHECMFSY